VRSEVDTPTDETVASQKAIEPHAGELPLRHGQIEAEGRTPHEGENLTKSNPPGY